ncbi:MAG: hypothetical protein Q8O31_00235 [Rhodocyclaceae bacterium]|nr:hypothetical protein [Rhodocyclaceae bacterium]
MNSQKIRPRKAVFFASAVDIFTTSRLPCDLVETFIAGELLRHLTFPDRLFAVPLF